MMNIGSMSTITLATRKVGRSTYFRKMSPNSNAGPRWKGVKGIKYYYELGIDNNLLMQINQKDKPIYPKKRGVCGRRLQQG